MSGVQNELHRNFIAGRWVDNQDILDVIDPATEASIGQVAMADAADLEKAITAAHKVHTNGYLTQIRPHIRSRMIWRIGDALESLKSEGARLLAIESGKRLQDAESEFDEAISYFRYYAGLSDKLEGRSIPLGKDYHDYTMHMPYGVTAHIIPWNFPLSIAARSLAPALAAGNTAVVKLPELAPCASLLLGKACQMAEVPDGAVSILCGDGPFIGDRLVNHSLVRQVVFTGSVNVGQQILGKLSHRVVPAVTELGGKSAAIVVSDADLDAVLSNVYNGIFFNAGQVCSAMSRLIVPRELQSEIAERIQSIIDMFTMGAGIENHDVTPVISSTQAMNIINMIQSAKDEGASLIAGGYREDRVGYFIAPTVFTDVSSDMNIAQNEIFGPVLALQPYDHLDEAIKIANNTRFGLASGVFTKDLSLAHKLAMQLEAGQIYINEWYAGGVETPFGGMKLSGNGRDKGQEAIFNYLQTKNVGIRLAG